MPGYGSREVLKPESLGNCLGKLNTLSGMAILSQVCPGSFIEFFAPSSIQTFHRQVVGCQEGMNLVKDRFWVSVGNFERPETFYIQQRSTMS